MATAPAEARKLDSGFLFKQLVERLDKQPPEIQQRIVAYVHERTGHSTIPAFHSNGATEEQKTDMYRQILKAILPGGAGIDSLQQLKPIEHPKTDAKPKPVSAPKLEASNTEKPATPMKKYTIPCTWALRGSLAIEADSLVSAIALARNSTLHPKESEIVPGTIVVDEHNARQINKGSQQCDSCDWSGDVHEMKHVFPAIPDLVNRVEAGGIIPSGECPKCFALCYPSKPE